MAYGGSGGMYSGGGSFTTSCLDDIPFKLGPKFVPPIKIVLPPGIDLCTPSRSTALSAEYSFEVEEAVLKWSAERVRQHEEQLQHELQRQATLRKQAENKCNSSDSEEESQDQQPIYENSQNASGEETLYENTSEMLYPKPAPRPRVPRSTANASKSNYADVIIPNPLIANISNDILQPTLINSGSIGSNGEQSETKTKTNDFDVTLFEKVDDPFDNLELQTINDMEVLANVLKETTRISPAPDDPFHQNNELITEVKQEDAPNVNSGSLLEMDMDQEIPLYENINLKVNKNGPINGKNDDSNPPPLDLTKLPPIPPRRDLVGRSPPLPPIGRPSLVSDSSLIKKQNEANGNIAIDVQQNTSRSLDASYNSIGVHNAQVNDANAKKNTNSSIPNSETGKSIIQRAPVKKPPRTFKYSRYEVEENNTKDNNEGDDYENLQIKPSDKAGNFSVQFKNAQSASDLKKMDADANSNTELNFVQHHFGKKSPDPGEKDHPGIARQRPVPVPRRTQSPPSRPSSQQSWNRYSPLPPPPVAPNSLPTDIVIPPRQTSPNNTNADPYTKLSVAARTSVDNLLTMGFAKDRTVRAVEKLGEDEKEVVEYLCLVDQLTEKGYNTLLVENALLLFNNSMNKASVYLQHFTKLQELGFDGEKIKDALVKTDNDREKALDILTAS